MIFQDPFSSLDPRMSVRDTIAEPLKIYGLAKSKEEIEKRVEAMMDTVGLSKRFINSYPHEMAGGRRQRIGIARALILDPCFIVCDEPVSALDVSIQAQILNLMQDLKREKGLTYLFITHDMSVVKHISDTICVMYLGKIVETSSTRALFRDPTHPIRRPCSAPSPSRTSTSSASASCCAASCLRPSTPSRAAASRPAATTPPSAAAAKIRCCARSSPGITWPVTCVTASSDAQAWRRGARPRPGFRKNKEGINHE